MARGHYTRPLGTLVPRGLTGNTCSFFMCCDLCLLKQGLHHGAVSQAHLNASLLVHPECFCTLNLLAVPPVCQACSCLRVFTKTLGKQSLALPLLQVSAQFLYQESRACQGPPIAQAETQSLTPPLAVPQGQHLLGSAGSRCQSPSEDQSPPTASCFN